MPRANIVNKRIKGVYRTPWKVEEGLELSGVCTANWSFCDFVIEMDDASAFVLGSHRTIHPLSRIDDLDAARESLTDVSQEDVEIGWCRGKGISDVLFDEGTEQIYLLLSDGRFLYNEDGPGGNMLIVSDQEYLSKTGVVLVDYWS
jgi:hypothetical protein